MIPIDWLAVMLGLAVGIAMSAFFFIGLAVGMRRALQRENPVVVLSVSAALRIAALLAVGWVVVGQGGPWAGLGYALAFLVVRVIATTWARAGADGAADAGTRDDADVRGGR